MIEKIKKRLINKYTLIIALLLSGVFFSCYLAHRHMVSRTIEAALLDYLDEEAWEAQQHLQKSPDITGMHKINSAANAIHNFTYWYANGKFFHAETPSDDDISAELQKRMLANAYQDNKIYSENIKRNHIKWYFLLTSRNLICNGQKVGRVFVLSNVSPLKWSNKQFIYAAVCAILILSALAYLAGHFLAGRAIEQINKFFEKQKTFVSDASHELRTPLSVLLAYTELLERKNDPEIVRRMKEEILEMSRLNSILLELARSDNDQIQMQYESFNLSELAAAVLDNIRQISAGKKLKLSIDAPAATNINADKNLVKRLLYILTDNAVKYTPDGGAVAITIIPGEKTATICIKDTGIGISATDLPHVFERFFRAEKSRNRNTGGLGLGLPLAEIIVRSHRGKINIASQEGAGTSVTVTLPLSNPV